jgi:thiamine biosynthesis lipoprotein
MNRRRALCVCAAAAGVVLLPRAEPDRLVSAWHGQALGARASMLLAHPDPQASRRVLTHALEEIWRLEKIFSLHLPGSELAMLNRDGRLLKASTDLRVVLSESRRISGSSGGAFDATVQPLWRMYAAHFARNPSADAGPGAHAIEVARGLVDYRQLEVEGARVTFARPGMAVTLNGIAQGYITDRVVDLLRDAGFANVLVQLGETFAGAPPADGRPWRIGIPDPHAPDRVIERFDVADSAVATSSGFATRFDRTGRHHHLLDPTTCKSPNHCAAVTVLAPRAILADGLATALAVLPPAAAPRLLGVTGATALHIAADGSRRWLGGA